MTIRSTPNPPRSRGKFVPSVAAVATAAVAVTALVAGGWLFSPGSLRAESPPAAPAGDATGVVEAWVESQAAVATARGQFVQERKLRTLKRPITKEGSFWFEAPGSIRWQVGPDPGELVAVKSDEGIAVIRPERGTVERFTTAQLADDPKLKTLAYLQSGFPRSTGEFFDTFSVRSVTREGAHHRVSTALRSGRDSAMVREIAFLIGTTTNRLEILEIHLRDGSSVAIRFSGVETGIEIPAGTFDVPDAGVTGNAAR